MYSVKYSTKLQSKDQMRTMLLGITARTSSEVLRRPDAEELTEEARGRLILGKTLYALTKPCELGAPMANYLLLTKGEVIYSSHEPVFLSLTAIASCYTDVDPKFMERTVILRDPKRHYHQKTSKKRKNGTSDGMQTSDSSDNDSQDESNDETDETDSSEEDDNECRITISSSVMSVWFERRVTEQHVNFANFIQSFKINRNQKTYTPYPRKRIIVSQGIRLPDIHKSDITTADKEFYYLILLALFKPQRCPADARKSSDGTILRTYEMAYMDFLSNKLLRKYAQEALQFEEYTANYYATASTRDTTQQNIEAEMISTLPSLPKSSAKFEDENWNNSDDEEKQDNQMDDNETPSKLLDVIPLPTEKDLGLIQATNLANAVLNTTEISLNAYQAPNHQLKIVKIDLSAYETNLIDNETKSETENTGTSVFLALPLSHEAKLELLNNYDLPTPFYDSTHLGPPDTSQLRDFCTISDISIALRLNFGQHAPFDIYGRALLKAIADDIKTADPTMDNQTEINSKSTQLIGFIGGDAGVGKSAVIKGLLLLATKWKRRELVETLAYTNIAACNVDGRTVHSARHLSRNGDFQATKMTQEEKQRVSRVCLIIVDEFSMFWLRLLGQLDSSTRSCAEPSDKKKIMGGKHLMLCGDLLQLPSTTNTPFYIEPSSSATLTEIQGWQLWQQINYIAFLTENKRQEADPDFQRLLVKLRWGALDEKDIAHINETCQTSDPLPAPPNPPESSQPYEFLSPVIVAKNAQRSAINRQTMLEIARSNELPIYEIMAEATSNVKRNQPRLNSLQYLNEDHSGFIPILFRFILYMPIMTTDRIQLAKSKSIIISKGTLGYIVGFAATDGNEFQERLEDGVLIKRFTKVPPYLLIRIRQSSKQYVATPNEDWEADFQQGIVALPVSRVNIQINLSQSNTTVSGELKKAQSFGITAFQYPLVPMYACTVEKVQGLTIPDGITIGNLLRKAYKEQALYVAFSRTLRLLQIRLVEALTTSYLKQFRPNITVAKQMLRLLQSAHLPNQPNHPKLLSDMRNWLDQRSQYAQNLIDELETQPLPKTVKNVLQQKTTASKTKVISNLIHL
jgi:hypothetical protein